MTTYKLYMAGFNETPNAVMTINQQPQISFIFDLNNTDYQTFKKEVLAGAELQDADGNVMTQAEADAFIATLP
jgi:hypothetical protein